MINNVSKRRTYMIIILSIIIFAASVKILYNNYKSAKKEEVQATAQIELKKTKNYDSYKTKATFIDLRLNSDEFYAKKVIIQGKVIELMEVADDGFSKAARIMLEEDPMYTIYITYGTAALSNNIKLNDYVKIYGTSRGLYTYESAAHYIVTVPLLRAAIIDLDYNMANYMAAKKAEEESKVAAESAKKAEEESIAVAESEAKIKEQNNLLYQGLVEQNLLPQYSETYSNDLAAIKADINSYQDAFSVSRNSSQTQTFSDDLIGGKVYIDGYINDGIYIDDKQVWILKLNIVGTRVFAIVPYEANNTNKELAINDTLVLYGIYKGKKTLTLNNSPAMTLPFFEGRLIVPRAD